MIRMQSAGFVASVLALAISAQAYAGTVTTDGADIVIKTKGGLEVATTDKNFSFKIGGRLQADYGRYDGFFTNNGNTGDAAYFRRAFLELSGTMFKDFGYVINYDLAHNAGSSSDGYFDEASMNYTGFGPVVLKFGRFDPDFGLEKATSSKWVTAMERNAAYEIGDWINSHENGLGVQVQFTPFKSLYLSGSGLAKNANDGDGDSLKQLNGRAVFAPLHESGNVLHFGVNYAYRDLKDTSFDARIRPRLTARGVSTSGGDSLGDNGNRALFGGVTTSTVAAGSFDDDSVVGLEFAFATGPLSLQAEYLKRTLKADSDAYDDVDASGYYGQVAYTLTGEPRTYKLGRFDTIKPENKSLGAWEVFYRYDHISVSDDNMAVTAVRSDGDAEASLNTVGLNWYVNESVKISGNYVHTSTDNITNAEGDDSGSAVVGRIQYVF